MDPGASHHLLFPGFMDAQVGCVDEAAQDQVGEVLTEVIKRHPAGPGEEQWKRLTREDEKKTLCKIKVKRSSGADME